MSVVHNQLEPGAYCDSIILMRLRGALEDLPGILEAGAVMATETNLSLLAESGLLLAGEADRRPDDLLVAVRAEDDEAATAALEQLPTLLRRRGGGGEESAEYRPKSLAAAVGQLPEARWVLISVPGRFAARVAREALLLDRNVFLYSDNVELAEEVELKQLAQERGLLVMGPDCGTAIVGGVGLGFANRVRRGPIGLVGASGTGLQAITAAIHALGGGVSQALGTGGRDLGVEVGGSTARAALDLLASDEPTRVIVLVSKPPAPAVAARLLALATRCGKPVVVYFLGAPIPARQIGNLHFACNLDEAAQLAMTLAQEPPVVSAVNDAPAPGFLRGLFAGGTLAQEAVLALGGWLNPLLSNVALNPTLRLSDPATSEGHCVVDLGADELTVGRLHPMIDQELRLRRFEREAADSEVGLILLDVVLGDGAHADPAAELVPVLEAARSRADLEIVVLVVGTDEDPQDMASQIERLQAAGATVFSQPNAAWNHVRARLAASPSLGDTVSATMGVTRARPGDLAAPLAAINVGVESFHDSLIAQEDPNSPKVTALHVEWRPPAGGDARMMAILDKLRSTE